MAIKIIKADKIPDFDPKEVYNVAAYDKFAQEMQTDLHNLVANHQEKKRLHQENRQRANKISSPFSKN